MGKKFINKDLDEVIVDTFDGRRKPMRRGWWATLISFIIAKIIYSTLTFITGLIYVLVAHPEVSRWVIKYLRSPWLSILFLVPTTIIIYKYLTSTKFAALKWSYYKNGI
jgi:hypothetical protein